MNTYDLENGSTLIASVTAAEDDMVNIIIDKRDAANLIAAISLRKVSTRDDREAVAKLIELTAAIVEAR